MKDNVTDRLNDLIALDIDAVEAYESAIQRMTIETLRERLREFQGDHERHIRELSAVVVRMGGTPRTRPDVKGFFIKGFTAATSMMGDRAALNAMKGNEKLTTSTYQRALQETWPDDVRDLIRTNYGDEERHLAFIQSTLETESWASENRSTPM
jgi:uncharacterized protein (TIGR02284 family)